jgi:signal transduction histidine kinase
MIAEEFIDEGNLAQRAGWLIRLRWLAATAVIVGTFVCVHLLGISVQAIPLYGIGAILFLYNAVVLMLLKRLADTHSRQSKRRMMGVIDLQISVDLIILTAMLHFSGGPENPLVSFYTFHMIIASILLSRWESYLQATLAVLLFAVLLLLESTGWVSHHCLAGLITHCMYDEGHYLAATLFFFAVTAYLVVYMTGYIAVRLRRAEMAQRQANRLLREKDRIKDEYVAHVTHDIKSHLAAIQSCLGVAATDSLTGAAAEFVDRAYRRTQTVTAFVRALLRLTRLKLDGQLEMEPFSVSDAVQRAVEGVQFKAREKSQHLDCAIDQAASRICGNEIAFREAITNLLFNAIKYTPDGGVIRVKTENQAGALAVEITDTGIGIPEGEQARIFEEFYRAANARQMERDGDGLGLSLVKRIIDIHGGTINFTSRLGEGTTFRITLSPAVSESAVDSAPKDAPSSGQTVTTWTPPTCFPHE